MVAGRHRQRQMRGWPQLALRVTGAGLLAASAGIHLAVAAVTAGPVRQADESSSPVAVMLAQVQAAAPMLIAAVGVVSVLALILLGVAVAGTGGPPAVAAGAAGPGFTLKTTKIGVTVLTNAKGLILYWFAPDTATASKCTGSCATYWPPVTGTPRAGPGVTGKLGTIKRPDGGTLLPLVTPRGSGFNPLLVIESVAVARSL